MECTKVLVRRGPPEGWMIESGRRELGPYYSCDMALRVAISEALALRRNGRPVQVAVAGKDGSIIASRCLCTSFAR